MSLLRELKRRNVLRVGAAYLAGAWLLIQLINEILPLFGVSDVVGRLVVLLLAIGVVPVLVFSWIFEWTPTGLKRDTGAEDSIPVDARVTRRFDRIVMAALSLAVVLFALDRFLLDPVRDQERVQAAVEQARTEVRLDSFGEKSIAVLPCDDLSDTGDQEYFAEGISEEVLNLLARLPDLRVAARTSAFAFKGNGATIPEIAEALRVSHVLECSVRRAGSQLRITAQLIEGSTDSHLWSETYNRDSGDVFAIQDDIASKVVDQLQITLLGPAPTVDETSQEIFDLYTLASYIVESRSPTVMQRLPEMRERLERAIEVDPDYLPIRSVLGRVYARLRGLQSEPEQQQELVRLIIELGNETRARWPDRPEAIVRYGINLANLIGDIESGAREVERAHQLDPDSVFVLRGAAEIASIIHRNELAIEIQEYVLRSDPFCAQCRNGLLSFYLEAEELDRAKEIYQEAVSLALELGPQGRLSYGLVLLASGEADAALNEFQKLPDPIRLFGSTVAYHHLGREVEAAQGLARIESMMGENNPALANLYVWMNELDAAVAVWDAQDELRPGMFEDVLLRSRMSQHPRWQSIAERAGIWPDPYENISFEIEVPAR